MISKAPQTLHPSLLVILSDAADDSQMWSDQEVTISKNWGDVGEMLPLQKEIAKVVRFETAPVHAYTYGLLIHDRVEPLSTKDSHAQVLHEPANQCRSKNQNTSHGKL